jgi:hypothetical protein
VTARGRERLARALAVAALGAGIWSAAVTVTGGFYIPTGPVSISSRDALRPAALAALAAAIAIWLAGADWRRATLARWSRRVGRGAAAGAATTARLARMSRWWAAALALAVGAVAWTCGSQTASGPDSFAYVSQAALWRTGQLDVPIPLAQRAPWPEAPATFAPFGYRAHSDGRSLVPITAPGLPLLMAAFQIAGGHRAAFLVVPIGGALTIWLTFLLGRRLRSDVAGLAAAWLVATSPAFLFMLMWPMSDIVAALWAALAAWLALGTSVRTAWLAGLAASAGTLTRPNFVLIAGAIGLWLALETLKRDGRPTAVKRFGSFAALLLPGVLVSMAVNLRWFGRALASGYGAAGDLLSVDRVVVNAGRYAAWLTDTSPLLWVGLIAMLVPLPEMWRRSSWRPALLFLFVVGATLSVYLVYQPFTDWWYLRFLLPAWPLAAVATALVLTALGNRHWLLGLTSAAVILAAGLQGVELARARGVFSLGEERYASVARLVATTTEPTATILTVSHSGTVRYYAGRETIRFDLLDPAWLDRAIQWLNARGRKPYILLEDWELPGFRERFGKSSAVGQLSFAPAATWEWSKAAGRVFIYDPIDRDRFATADPGALLDRDQPRSAPSRFPKLAYER